MPEHYGILLLLPMRDVPEAAAAAHGQVAEPYPTIAANRPLCSDMGLIGHTPSPAIAALRSRWLAEHAAQWEPSSSKRLALPVQGLKSGDRLGL
jgi:hypothetical protein